MKLVNLKMEMKRKKKDDNDKKDTRKEMKKKPKVRLEMHMDQFFVDCNDAYVWIYEPIPVYYWFFGTLLVLGAIGVCLFSIMATDSTAWCLVLKYCCCWIPCFYAIIDNYSFNCLLCFVDFDVG